MKELSKSSNVIMQVEEKGKNMDPFNTMTQEDDKSVEGKTYSDVVVHMMKFPSEYFVTSSKTSILEVNEEVATHMII